MKKGRIMIVEDEIITAMDLKLLLERRGYEVSPLTTSGTEAIRRAETERPDIVIMDVNILGETDGIETAGRIYSLFGIPTIFMTGYNDNEVRERISRVKSAGCLIKPLDFGKLEPLIDNILRRA